MKPELKGAFLTESRGLVSAMLRGLSDGAAVAAALPELRRFAHTLKGNAKLAGLADLERVVGGLVAQLKAAKERGGIDKARIDLWREAAEACRELVEERPFAGLQELLDRLGPAAREGAPAALRLLLIEDSDVQARLIRNALASGGTAAFSLERADRLAVGLERAAQGGIDAVLLDLDLPDSSGLESFDRLSAKAPALPVVVLTASEDEGLAAEALSRGAQDYVIKGRADGDLLTRTIRYAVERKRAETALRRAREELEARVRERTAELTIANETLRAAQEELRRKSDDLERTNVELGQFASMASHELQGPLRKIIAFGQLLERSAADLDPQAREFLRKMRDAALQESKLINSLGELSLVTRTARPFERVELVELVRDVLADLGALLARIGGRVELGPLPAVMADPVQLKQVFHNLLGNAVKYRKQDEPLQVAVRSRDIGPDKVEITIEDNGIGFEQRYAARIFEPFERLHAAGKFEGVGMGLAICDKIVRRHGGTISARSEPGKGSAFSLTLPKG